MTRTTKTEQAYGNRAKQIAEGARTAAGRALSPTELAETVIARRTQLASSTFRQNRAALRFTMNETAEYFPKLAPEMRAAIAILEDAESIKRPDELMPRTSQMKLKRLDDDLDRICHGALATRSPNASTLVDCLTVGSLTGARLVEWPTAQFGPSSQRHFEWELKLENGNIRTDALTARRGCCAGPGCRRTSSCRRRHGSSRLAKLRRMDSTKPWSKPSNR
ncbi:hypothetical protein [Bradyrhizobium sp. STM 3562]|uniref:hypothetical protein n=1 Tax=Bradyrhizobium sp. STM 3562 TaxID=578924 RepID=UPI00388E9C58